MFIQIHNYKERFNQHIVTLLYRLLLYLALNYIDVALFKMLPHIGRL